MCFRETLPISLKPVVGCVGKGAPSDKVGFGALPKAMSCLPVGGVPDPLSTPAAFMRSHEVGGDLIVKVKDRFVVSIVNLTGVGVPGWRCDVLALNSEDAEVSRSASFAARQACLCRNPVRKISAPDIRDGRPVISLSILCL